MYGTVAQITYAVTDQLPETSKPSAVAMPVTLQPVAGGPPVGWLSSIAGLRLPLAAIEPPPPRAFLPPVQLTVWVLGVVLLLALVSETTSRALTPGPAGPVGPWAPVAP